MKHPEGVVGHRGGADLDGVGLALAVVVDGNALRRAHYLFAAKWPLVMHRVQAVARPVALFRGDPEPRIADDRLDALDRLVPLAVGRKIDVARIVAHVATVRVHAAGEDGGGIKAIIEAFVSGSRGERGAAAQQRRKGKQQNSEWSAHDGLAPGDDASR
jgi:hypothetical protein